MRKQDKKQIHLINIGRLLTILALINSLMMIYFYSQVESFVFIFMGICSLASGANSLQFTIMLEREGRND